MITAEGIIAAERVIRPYIRRTPIVQVEGEDLGGPAGPLVLKLELLQQSGSFKARGAFANLLLRKVPPAGVVAASGGNHGAAVAVAARKLSILAHIFVPRICTPAGGIAADSLAPRRVGERVLPIAQKLVKQVVLVTDEAIAHAQRILWGALRIAAEPGGAAALAAILSGRYRPRAGQRVAIVISSGNTSAVKFQET